MAVRGNAPELGLLRQDGRAGSQLTTHNVTTHKEAPTGKFGNFKFQI
jgi:hypothetical protein